MRTATWMCRIGLWVTLVVSFGAAARAEVVALKRDPGLQAGGAIDSRFANATVVTTTVHDAAMGYAQTSRWYNGGTSLKASSYAVYKLDFQAVPGLPFATIHKAELRLYRTTGNVNGKGVAMVLTHDWLEGTKAGTYPGGAGGVSTAHPIGYNTNANQNASGGTSEPWQSWGPNADSFFTTGVDCGPVQLPSSEKAGAGYHVIDVTAHVQEWVRGISPNYGWFQAASPWDFHLSESGWQTQPVLFIDFTQGGDVTPPAAITDLAAGNPTAGTVSLTWTAPGDDGHSGTATAYDIRYSTRPITEANWGSASRVEGEPAPQLAGITQPFLLSGLTMGTTYYFAIKTCDAVPNVSALSNTATAQTQIDVTAPAAIADLATSSPMPSTMTLTWTAPGDDDSTGTATRYDIRYSTSTIDDTNWDSAVQVVGEPAAAVAGTVQSMVVPDLLASTTYYFAIKTSDETPNVSPLSNIAAGQTPADTIAPSTIADLVASHPSSGTVRLTWTSPGDDGTYGTATAYDIRYSISPLSDASWPSAIRAAEVPTAQLAGIKQVWTVQGLSAGTTWYFAIKAVDDASNWSGLSNVVSQATLSNTTLNRPVLCPQDFEYLGAFKLPKTACGYETSFALTGLAIRRVNGNLQLLTGTARSSGDAIYECNFPGWGTSQSTWPQAVVVREWGTAVYGNPPVKEFMGGGTWTHGLSYDQTRNRFYYSFGPEYNPTLDNDPSLAWAELNEGTPVVCHGAWNAPSDTAHCMKIRGGSLAIPDWFAAAYLSGRSLGLGFGGYYSGYGATSKGPYLAATYHPEDSTTQLDVVPLISHTNDYRGIRDADYYTEISWSPNPVGDLGWWTPADDTQSAAWIDLPDKQGLLILSSMAHDRIWYYEGQIRTERQEFWWWVYDPKDLAAVAQGQKQSWEPEPLFWQMQYDPCPTRISAPGCAFDPQTRTLFVLTPHSYLSIVNTFPVVHGWRIKQTFYPGDVDRDGHVDVVDLLYLVDAFGSADGDANYDSRCDFNSDGYVDVVDLLTLVENFGT